MTLRFRFDTNNIDNTLSEVVKRFKNMYKKAKEEAESRNALLRNEQYQFPQIIFLSSLKNGNELKSYG
jgi:hypothetical protein